VRTEDHLASPAPGGPDDARHETPPDAEVQFRTLVEQIPAITYVEVDDNTFESGSRVIYVSPQVQGILGYSPEELLADPEIWNRLTHPDDLPGVLDEEVRAGNMMGAFLYEYRMFTRDGEVRWFRDESMHADDPVTGTRMWHGIMIDITQERRAQEQARDAELRYRSLVEALPAMVFIDSLDEVGSNLYTSPQSKDILGYTPEEWTADRELWLRMIHPEDRDRVVAAHLSGHPGFDEEYRMIRKDGTVIWVRDVSNDVIGEDGTPVFSQGFLMDITDRKDAERALHQSLARERTAADQLRGLDRMKNTVLRTLQQDLRQPLTAVLTAAATLEQHGAKLPEAERADMLRVLANRARTMDDLLTVLLDLDRLESGSTETNRRDVDLAELVKECLDRFDGLQNREVTIDLRSAPAWADPEKVERILENLLTNAGRHTPLDSHVWIRVEPVDGGGQLIVDDDGPGVCDDMKTAVFEPFRQGDTDAAALGMGIGLSFVSRFAELHGGRAWVEDRPGGGASFRVFLPA
jgi:PAS domain S-box-containing protein